MAIPEQYKELLAFFKAGLASGLIDKDELTTWADGIIILEADPDIFFIELSLIKSSNEGISYLGEYLKSKPLANGKVLLGLLCNRFSEVQHLERVVRTLQNIKDIGEFTDLEYDYISHLDGDFDLATENIYGSLNDVKQKIGAFLTIYKNYSLEDHSIWPELNKQTDLKLEGLTRIAKKQEKLNRQ